CGACDRLLWLGQGGVGQRSSRGDANRLADAVGRGDARNHCRLLGRRTGPPAPRQCRTDLQGLSLAGTRRPGDDFIPEDQRGEPMTINADRIAVSTWSLHRLLGVTYPHDLTTSEIGPEQASYGTGDESLLGLPSVLAN